MNMLATIIAAAERLGRGDLSARTELPHDNTELGRMAEAIDRIAEELQSRSRHIEQVTRRARRSNRALRTLSASNRTLLRATEEQAQIREICRLVVEIGGYPIAWVGYAQNDAAKTILPVAAYGTDSGFIHQLKVTWDESQWGNGPAGMAVRHGKPALIRDIASDAQATPWRETIMAHGIASVLGLPLRIHGKVEGMLNILSHEKDAFDDEEVILLEESANDLAFAIETLRTRQRQREAEEAFQRVSHQNALILQAAGEGIYGLDIAGNINFINPAAASMLGYAQHELLGCNSHAILHHSKSDGTPYPIEDCAVHAALATGMAVERGEELFWRKDGTPLPVELSSTPIEEDGKLLGAVVTLTDISERKRYLAQLERKSNFDDLTGLPNRNLLADRLAHAVDRSRREDKQLAVLSISLNRFRDIVESLGHKPGNEVLRQAAERLGRTARRTDTLARAEGNEFVLVLEAAETEPAALIAQALLDTLMQPMQVEGREVFLTASIGISVFPKDGDNGETLLKNAATALHRARNRGDNQFRFYAAEMNARSLDRLDMEISLRRALEKGELDLYYQPQISLHNGEIFGAEALLRWQHPERGLIAPGEFVPLLEATGLIIPIGEWVLHTACAQLKTWQQAGMPEMTVAVNLSARQFDAQDIVKLTSTVLASTRLDPRHLELELTESMIMADAEAFIHALKQLKQQGVSISIDDFGTGYSSLSYLKRFAINRLKIDQLFVRDITHDPNAAAITLAIIALARSMKLRVLAEGVETEAQLNFLRNRGCEEMQGYYFSPPLPLADFEQVLRERRKLSFPSTHHKPENTLLLVDDEPAILAAIKRMLRGEGCRILTAGSGMEALDILASNEVGVVISDARMPEMSGADFLDKVREIYPETVRIMLSGYTDLQAITDAVNKGEIFRFLTKPWEDEKLVDTIRTAFRHYEKHSGHN